MHKRLETQIGVMCKGKSEEYVAEVKATVEKMGQYMGNAGAVIQDTSIIALIMVNIDKRSEK